MKILYGTTNRAKLQVMRRSIRSMPVDILGLDDMEIQPPEVEEIGSSPEENARIKAEAYYHFYHMPVLACDTGLFFEGIPDEYQPGIRVRIVNGKALTDDEMIAWYGSLVRRFGELRAQYRNALCLYYNEAQIFTHMGDDISGAPFLLTETPCAPVREKGFPLDSMSRSLETGEYFYEEKGHIEEQLDMREGFRRFFEHIIQQIKEER